MRVRLGATELLVSRLGFGGWQLGGKGWGSYSAAEAVRTIAAAVERGVNLFDTAPVYGFGRSEEVLGKTLAGLGEECVVVSKGGLVWDASRRVAHDGCPDSLRRQLLASLSRLRRQQLEAYVLHWPDPDVPTRESAAALESFRSEGLIRSWGVANLTASQLEDLLRTESPPGFLEQPLNVLGAYPDEHQAAAREETRLLALAAAHGLGVLAFDVLARGFLGRRGRAAAQRPGRKDVRRRDWRFDPKRSAALLGKRAHFERQAELQGEPLTAVCIRTVLARRGVTACLVGMKSRTQLEENLRYDRVEIDGSTRTAGDAL